MKKQTITLSTKDGPQDVQAYSTDCPNLFIHKPLEGDSGTWRVSHIPTGYCIFPHSKKLAYAFRACYIWSQIPEWNTLTPETASEFFKKYYDPILRDGRDAALGTLSPSTGL